MEIHTPVVNSRSIDSAVLVLDKVIFENDGRKIIDKISFSIYPGTFNVLLGPNGSGKTTLFSLISRLYLATSGEISVFSLALNQYPCRILSNSGIVFQTSALDEHLTVEQNLYYHAALRGMSRQIAKSKFQKIFEKQMPDRSLKQKVFSLSGGGKRRLDLIRSLMHDPKLLLLDEPTVGLDFESRENFITWVRTLCHENNICVLWSTHLVDEISNNDNVIILSKGKLLADDVAINLVKKTGSTDFVNTYAKLQANSDIHA